jgi:hypothetical protein
MRSNLIPLAALLAAACATTETARSPYTEAAQPPPVSPAPAVSSADVSVDNAKLDPARYAASFPGPDFCEREARRLAQLSADTGWAVLRACITRGRFTLLERVIGGAWDKDLQSRPEASRLLARIIADRGGDIEGDLAALRKQRVPIFAMAASIKQPEVYKGRLVLFRGQVRDVKADKGKSITARLDEYAIAGTSKYVDSEVRGVIRDRYSNSSGYGGEGETTFLRQRRLTGNDASETGVEVVARLAKLDPFFEPGRQFIVLARLDGVRDTPGEGPDEIRKVALVSVVAYFEPNAAVIE